MKTELSKHELWKQKVSEIIMNVHLSEYIKPYRRHKNDPEDTYGVFDNTTKHPLLQQVLWKEERV